MTSIKSWTWVAALAAALASMSRAWIGILACAAVSLCAGTAPAEDAKKDSLGDSLPEGVTVRLGSGRLRHSGAHSVGFADDGKLVVTVAPNGLVRWDATTGKEVGRLNARKTPLEDSTIASDGKTLVLKRNAKFAVHDPVTGKEVRKFEGSDTHGGLGVLSGDGSTLLVTGADSFYIYDVASAKLRTTVKMPPDGASFVQIAGDGSAFCVVDGSKTHIIDAKKGAERALVDTHDDVSTAAALSRDGKLLVTAAMDLSVWDAMTGKLVRKLASARPETGGVVLCYGMPAFSPDGALLLAPTPDAFQLFEVATWKALRPLDGGRDTGPAMPAFSPDGKRIVGMVGAFAHVWDVATGKTITHNELELAYIHGVACSKDGKKIATADRMDNMVRVWEAATGKLITSIKAEGQTEDVAFTSDGAAVIVGDGPIARVCDATTGKELRRSPDFSGGGEPLQDLGVDGHGRVVLETRDEINLWPADGAGKVRTCSPKRGLTDRLAVARDAERAAASAEIWSCIVIYDTSSGKELRRIPVETSSCVSISISADGSLVAASLIEKKAPVIRTWNTASGVEGKTIALDSYVPIGIALSPDGTALAWVTNEEMHLDDVATGKELRKLAFSCEFLWSVAFTADGGSVIECDVDGQVLIRDLTQIK